MSDNLSVKITADVVDLQAKMAIAKAETQAFARDMNAAARQVASGGIGDAVNAQLTQSARASLPPGHARRSCRISCRRPAARPRTSKSACRSPGRTSKTSICESPITPALPLGWESYLRLVLAARGCSKHQQYRRARRSAGKAFAPDWGLDLDPLGLAIRGATG